MTDTKLVWDVRHGCQSELSFYCARNSACVFERNAIKSQEEKYRTKCGSYFEFSHTGTFLSRDGEREMTVSGFVSTAGKSEKYHPLSSFQTANRFSPVE